jgi:membrane-associated phospholipid phosphatase
MGICQIFKFDNFPNIPKIDTVTKFSNYTKRLGYSKQGRQGNFWFPSAHVTKAFSFLIAKSKIFGGLDKQAQAHN